MMEEGVQALEADACVEITCPHCGAVERDDFEVLDDDIVQALRCGACGSRFHLLIAECPACNNESAITWRNEPGADALRRVRCLHCDARWMADEEDLRRLDGTELP